MNRTRLPPVLHCGCLLPLLKRRKCRKLSWVMFILYVCKYISISCTSAAGSLAIATNDPPKHGDPTTRWPKDVFSRVSKQMRQFYSAVVRPAQFYMVYVGWYYFSHHVPGCKFVAIFTVWSLLSKIYKLGLLKEMRGLNSVAVDQMVLHTVAVSVFVTCC